jgi:hypothetical protein
MARLSFFFNNQAVFKTSLKALKRRDYIIKEIDEENGIIRAAKSNGVLKPRLSIEIKIQQINSNQTSIDISSELKKAWHTPQGYKATAEQNFINTLYKCFESL